VARDAREQLLVLVIDREQRVLEEVSRLLSAAGFECCCCTTAEEAITAALQRSPDLIISDWSLRGEGVETVRQIKRQPGLEHVPAMFLSGAQRPDVVRRAHVGDSGAYCLRKPFAANVLVELVDRTLGFQGAIAGV
jgi:DNA-binding response OmpR family regulator